ncbi:MAG: GNAT family N-acetyltransferase [Clostridiales bacterium]|jgi:predicted acetyltransferase|nr:GNAT family N-acetyltransferase [Clostridiales bacterium]
MDTLKLNYEDIRLIVPQMSYMDSYRAAYEEYGRRGVEDFAYPKVASRRNAAAYLKRLENFRRGIDIPKGYVPSSGFWLVDGRHYLGSGDVRHYLTDNLRKLGGNIGYSINPLFWRRGLGTLQLQLLLKEAKKLHITKPVITCFDENTPSAKIIEKNGGVLIKKINNRFRGQDRLTRIYEIDLTQQC